MPRIVPGSKHSPWVPSADARATRTTSRTLQTARRKAEREAQAKVRAMPPGTPVEAVYRMTDGPPWIRRGVMLSCHPWAPEPAVLVAVIRLADGTTLRVDATRVRRARGG